MKCANEGILRFAPKLVLKERNSMSQVFDANQGSFIEEGEEDVGGGGCCGGGDAETASTASRSVSRSKSNFDDMNEEGTGGGGCCGGADDVDEEESEAGEEKYLSGTMKSGSKLADESGGCCCCCSGGAQDEENDLEGSEEGMPIRLMSSKLPSRRTEVNSNTDTDVNSNTDAAPQNFAKPAAEMASDPLPEPAEETQLVLDEGMYFVYSHSSGGSTAIQFSRKGLKDGICYAKFTSESKIPAFKFRGTGQTPLSDRCMSDKMMFFKGACLYLKSCKQYKTEPCLYNPEFGSTPIELFLLSVEGSTYIVTEMEIGEFYDLQLYSYAVAAQADSLSKIYDTSGMAVSMMEYNNAILEAKGYRIEL